MASRASRARTVAFAAVLCVVCSLLVSGVSVTLHERQEENRRLHRQRHVLLVAGVAEEHEDLTRAEISSRFARFIEVRAIHLRTGAWAAGIDAANFDPRRASVDHETSREAPDNAAGVPRLPEHALVYLLKRDGAVAAIVLPVEGLGLWSRLSGYIALSRDTRTVYGVTFYEHAETPGLGAELDDPRWKARWRGRLAFDEAWRVKLEVIKGRAGPPETDPYRVDGISGATLTGDGVTALLRFWLGEHGFGPFLRAFREAR